jgi:DNA replication and repair protein RecF
MQHNNDIPVCIEKIQLNQFRCFDTITIDLNSSIVLVEGNNGTGKTSLLEALHYTCYLRSFRTHLQKELVYGNQSTFFIKVLLRNQEFHHNVQVGFSHTKRVVRIDGKAIASYKELMDYYRIVSITEDDIALIKGPPELRRDFLDSALFLISPDSIELIKKLRKVVEHRNGLLRDGQTIDFDLYRVWTEQLWYISMDVQRAREHLLAALAIEIEHLLKTYFDSGVQLKLTYRNKNGSSSKDFAEFWPRAQEMARQEKLLRRSVFGAHLDDFDIFFYGMNARVYASRGQQKLILFLMKIALLKITANTYGSAILLVDDFMTDFDEQKLRWLVPLLVATKNQLIFTCPTTSSVLRNVLSDHNPLIVKLTG